MENLRELEFHHAPDCGSGRRGEVQSCSCGAAESAAYYEKVAHHVKEADTLYQIVTSWNEPFFTAWLEAYERSRSGLS